MEVYLTLLKNPQLDVNAIAEKLGKDNSSIYKELLNYVYDKESKNEYFRVDDDLVRDFEGIFLHLENASLIAVEKFFEMEGSFVRDELQIPVVPKSMVDELKGANGSLNKNPSDFVGGCVIPISFRVFKNLDRRKIEGVVKDDEGKTKLVKKDEDSWLMSILERTYVQPKEILKYIFARNVLAFVVDADYDDKGLRFGKHD